MRLVIARAQEALLHRKEVLDSASSGSSAPSAEHDTIDRALSRIERGTYGLCEQCNRPIGAQRLKAIPEMALCASCSLEF